MSESMAANAGQYNDLMSRLPVQGILALLLTTCISLVSTSTTLAVGDRSPQIAASPNDLINAVNALRASYGVAPYTVSPILMTTAQNQADYMAATGHSSHTGPGGSTVTDRLLAAGYPLAGDLSLGGFRSENITSGNEQTTADAVIKQWSGDTLHLTTMISPNLTEIGAGVSVNNGRAYFVIDCALPTTAGAAQMPGTTVVAGSPVPAGAGGVIIPVVVSTPDAQGDLIHEVKAGQTLWQIAISYNTTIDEIKRLNNLFDNEIYPGTRLLIRMGVAVVPPPMEVATLPAVASSTSPPIWTPTILSPTWTSAPLEESSAASPGNIMAIALGILALAILGGGFVAWLGSAKK